MSTARALAWVVSVLSGLALFFVVFLLVLSPLQEARSQSLLYGQFRSGARRGHGTVRGRPDPAR